MVGQVGWGETYRSLLGGRVWQEDTGEMGTGGETCTSSGPVPQVCLCFAGA